MIEKNEPLMVIAARVALQVTEIAAAADAVVANIDTTSLALHLAATKLGASSSSSSSPSTPTCACRQS
jgi:hypothetical protein